MALLSKSEERLIAGEELLRRPDLEPCELVEGRIVSMTPTGYLHGRLERRIARSLEDWSKDRQGAGEVVAGEVGIYIRRNPDTVRAADVLYISNRRLEGRVPTGYLDVPPELVVEILSPDDRWNDVTAKLADYFEAGVDRVWIVAPKLRRVFIYRSLTDVRQLEAGNLLTDEEILPEFSLLVADLFQE